MQKVKLSIKDFFSKYDSSFLRIWSHLLKKPLMKSSIFCAFLSLKRLAIAGESKNRRDAEKQQHYL